MGILKEAFVEAMANQMFTACQKEEKACFIALCNAEGKDVDSRVKGAVRTLIIEHFDDQDKREHYAMDDETWTKISMVGQGKHFTKALHTWLWEVGYPQWLGKYGWDALVESADLAPSKFKFVSEASRAFADDDEDDLVVNRKYALVFEPCITPGQTALTYVLQKSPLGKIMCLCPSKRSSDNLITGSKQHVRFPKEDFEVIDELGRGFLLGISLINLDRAKFHEISAEKTPKLTKKCPDTGSHHIDEDKMREFLQFLDKQLNWRSFKLEFTVVEEK